MALKFFGDGDARIREYGELLDENEAYDEAGADWGVGFDGDFQIGRASCRERV